MMVRRTVVSDARISPFYCTAGPASGSALRGSEPALRGPPRVPSLGRCIDRYLEAFGFSTEAVISIHHAFRGSADTRTFAQRLPASLPMSKAQAEWIYENIERHENDDFDYSCRNVWS